jgi:hypothetical protein
MAKLEGNAKDTVATYIDYNGKNGIKIWVAGLSSDEAIIREAAETSGVRLHENVNQV